MPPKSAKTLKVAKNLGQLAAGGIKATNNNSITKSPVVPHKQGTPKKLPTSSTSTPAGVGVRTRSFSHQPNKLSPPTGEDNNIISKLKKPPTLLVSPKARFQSGNVPKSSIKKPHQSRDIKSEKITKKNNEVQQQKEKENVDAKKSEKGVVVVFKKTGDEYTTIKNKSVKQHKKSRNATTTKNADESSTPDPHHKNEDKNPTNLGIKAAEVLPNVENKPIFPEDDNAEVDKENVNPNIIVSIKTNNVSAKSKIIDAGDNSVSATNDIIPSASDTGVGVENVSSVSTNENIVVHTSPQRKILSEIRIARLASKPPKSPQIRLMSSASSPSPLRKRALSLPRLDDSFDDQPHENSSDLPEIYDCDTSPPHPPGYSGKGILKPGAAENSKRNDMDESTRSPKRRRVEISEGNNHTRYFHCENIARKGGKLRHVPGGLRDRNSKEQRRRRSFSEYNDCVNSINSPPWTIPKDLGINTSFGGQFNGNPFDWCISRRPMHQNSPQLCNTIQHATKPSFRSGSEPVNFDSICVTKQLQQHIISDEGRPFVEMLLGNAQVSKIFLEEQFKRSDFKENTISRTNIQSSNLYLLVDGVMRDQVKEKCNLSLENVSSPKGMLSPQLSMPTGFWCDVMENLVTTAVRVATSQKSTTASSAVSLSQSQDAKNFKTTLMREIALQIINEDQGALEYLQTAKNLPSSS